MCFLAMQADTGFFLGEYAAGWIGVGDLVVKDGLPASKTGENAGLGGMGIL